MAELQPLSPPALERTVRKCLEKDPALRWQTAADLRDELSWIAQSPPPAEAPIARRSLLAWSAASAAAGAVLTGLGTWSLLRRTPPERTRTTRFRWQPPQGVWLDRMVTRQTLAISPSGSEIAFVGRDQKETMIYLRRLGSQSAEPLAGTEGAQTVFWSPDSQTIGFYAAGKLKRIPASGGTSVPICELPAHWCATWNSQGQILAAASRAQSMLVDVASGSVTTWKSVFWPSFLPDGKRLLYLDVDRQIGGYRAFVEEIASGRKVALIPIETRAAFCPNEPGDPAGHLFYAKSGTLVAHPFDTDRLAFTAEPIPVAEGLPYFRPAAWAEFSVSQERSIAFTTGYRSGQLAFVDRSGKRLDSLGQPQPFWGDFRISRDGRRVAAGKFDIVAGGVDIWVYDLESGAADRSSFLPGVEAVAVWSPDGRRIAYGSAQSSAPQLRVKSATGPGGDVSFPPGDFQLPSDWTADGKWILFQTSGGDSDAETLLASPDSGKLFPLLKRPFDHSQAVLSPDGKWLAFVANESGLHEVFVQRFEDGGPPRLTGERKRVSLTGGTFPRWNSNGRELFFRSLNREVVAVPFNPALQPSFGPPQILFSLPVSFRAMTNLGDGFDVHPDGNRFLVLFGEGASESLDVISHWRPPENVAGTT